MNSVWLTVNAQRELGKKPLSCLRGSEQRVRKSQVVRVEQGAAKLGERQEQKTAQFMRSPMPSQWEQGRGQ